MDSHDVDYGVLTAKEAHAVGMRHAQPDGSFSRLFAVVLTLTVCLEMASVQCCL